MRQQQQWSQQWTTRLRQLQRWTWRPTRVEREATVTWAQRLTRLMMQLSLSMQRSMHASPHRVPWTRDSVAEATKRRMTKGRQLGRLEWSQRQRLQRRPMSVLPMPLVHVSALVAVVVRNASLVVPVPVPAALLLRTDREGSSFGRIKRIGWSDLLSVRVSVRVWSDCKWRRLRSELRQKRAAIQRVRGCEQRANR